MVRRDTIVSGPLVSGALRAEREATVRAELGGSVLQVTISGVRNDLPPEMEEPILTRFDPADLPIVSLTLTSKGLSNAELTRLADPEITRELRGLPGGDGAA